MFLDALFYSVLAPLLPELSHQLHLSKLSAGLMTAFYAGGTLFAALPAGLLAARCGPRFVACFGLLLLGCSTLAFAWFDTAPGLDVARFVEGIGGACSWTGGLAWIANETAAERRGAAIGQAVAAGIAGTVFGPVLGTLGGAVGRPVLFSGLALAAGALIALTLSLPDRRTRSPNPVGALMQALRNRSVAAGMWFMGLPALVAGTVSVVAPLRMHRLGAGIALIGVTWLVAAGLEAGITPAVGAASDRRGRFAPVRVGLPISALLLASFTLPSAAPLLGALVAALSVALACFWAPATAMVSDALDLQGLDQGVAGALTQLAWAGGQVLGAAAGGAAAKVYGDGVPAFAAAALCVVSMPIARSRRWHGLTVKLR